MQLKKNLKKSKTRTNQQLKSHCLMHFPPQTNQEIPNQDLKKYSEGNNTTVSVLEFIAY